MWAGVGKFGWPTSSRIVPGSVMATLEISRMPEWAILAGPGERGGKRLRMVAPRVNSRAAGPATHDLQNNAPRPKKLRPPPQPHRILPPRRRGPDQPAGPQGRRAGDAGGGAHRPRGHVRRDPL